MIPFFSSLYAKQIRDGSILNHNYWRLNGENAVLFYPAVAALVKANDRPKMFLEIGPHGALAGPLRQIMKTLETTYQYVYASTSQRNSHATHSFLDGLGNMYLRGIAPDFAPLHDGKHMYPKVLTNLPTYPWNYSATDRFWTEPRLSKEWRLQKYARHDLLGARVTATSELEPTWRNLLSTDRVPWVRDHVVQGNIVLPFVGFVSMAAAAVQQVTDMGAIKGKSAVSLRHVVVRQALIMYEGKDVELSTTLRRSRLTDTLNSGWWEFSVSSYSQDSSTWIPHCAGEVQVSTVTISTAATRHKQLPRSVDPDYWYKIMGRAGLSYGPEFRGLANITTDPTSNRASCSISQPDRRGQHMTKYRIHPCEMDICLQSVFLAMTRGLGRRFDRALVPVTIDEITLGEQTSTLHTETSAQVEAGRGDVVASITGYDDQGSVVLQIKGLRASALHAVEKKKESRVGARVRWMPDIRFMDLAKLVRPLPDRRDQMIQLETLSLLYIAQHVAGFEPALDPAGYLGKHFQWLLKRYDDIKNGRSEVVPNCQEILDLSENDRRETIQGLEETLAKTEVAHPAAAITKAFQMLPDVLEGKVGAVEGLFQDDTLANVYRFMDFGYCQDFFKCLAHAKPTMRILEIGGGTGGATRKVLANLFSSSGEQMYSSYTFTDISAGFFGTAKETLRFPGFTYQVLDISEDPIAQGFGEQEFDLIIAANVLHATPSLNTTLSNVRKLLKPDGHLFLQEVSLQSTWISSIFGLLEGWWLGEKDGRVDEPYISADRWNQELQQAGFDGTDLAAYDHETPYQVNVCIVSRPSPPVGAAQPSKNVTLLIHDVGSALYAAAAEVFANQGYTIQACQFGEQQQASNDVVVSLLDLEKSVFHDMSPERLQILQSFFRQCKSTQVIWATRSSQVECQDPYHAMTIGAIRTLRGELGLPITSIELKNTTPEALQSLLQVLEVQQQHAVAGDGTSFALDADYEYSYSKGMVMIPRIMPFSIADQLLDADSSPEHDVPLEQKIKLQAISGGGIDSLSWVATPADEPCGDLDVEVDVKCVGLNFKDMLIAMSLVRDVKSELGLDGAGIVCNVGPGVTSVKTGDRVMFYAGGAFANRITINHHLCVLIPERLSFEEAATMPCVFATAIYSILELGGLQRGQTVLIHSACGAVGLAALQLCQMAGAVIYATVGTPEKVQHLQDKFAIPRDMIFSSRDAAFANNIMSATGGRGVDLVLNSLSGELLHASWQCVAKFGRMVEIGKRDFQGHAKLQMSLFESNRSFFGVDLHEISAEAPHVMARLLAKTMALYDQGAVAPISIVEKYEAAEVQTAFRHIQQGKHIGKIIVNMDVAGIMGGKLVTRQPKALSLDKNAAYLLVGGMGGLGRAVSSWLVEYGARHLMFLSRSAGQGANDKAFADELASQGCTVQMIPGSITSPEDVSAAVKAATVPIKGVLNLSMVLQASLHPIHVIVRTARLIYELIQDRAFLDMTQEDWDTAVLPKVQGTQNLHEATKHLSLDFFVLFGSFCGMIGQWSQANYAAANTYLDAFVQYRHQLGLPASVMDIGVVEDHGYVSRSAEITATFKNWGAGMIQEQDLLDALQLSILQSFPSRKTAPTSYNNSFLNSILFSAPSQLMIGLKTTKPLSDPSTRVRWRRDARMAMYHNDSDSDNTNSQSQSQSQNSDSGLRSLLEAAATDPSVLSQPENIAALTRAIGLKIHDLMMLPAEELDTTASLAAMGVDSLIVMEILSWWKTTFKFSVGTLEFLNCSTIEGVGKLAVAGVLSKAIVL